MVVGDDPYSGMTLAGSYQTGGSGNVLQNGVPVSNLAGGLGSQQSWTMSVPSGASNLQFQMSGGTGDADLYVRFGSAPTLSTYDCRPFASGNNETCTFASPAAGTWHVLIVGDDPYAGVTLLGSYQTGPACNSIPDVEPNDSTSAPQAISGSCNQIAGTFVNETAANDYFRLSLPAGKTVTALLNGLTADYDLFLYNAAGTEVAKSINGGTTADQASWTNTSAAAVNVYIRVNRYVTTKATYQLKISY
jgi:serine protease